MKPAKAQKIISSLAIFKDLRIATKSKQNYADLAGDVYAKTGGNFTKYVADLVLNDENPHLKTLSEGRDVSKALEKRTTRELEMIQELLDLDGSSIRKIFAKQANPKLPKLKTEKIDIAKLYNEQAENLKTQGYGIYKNHIMFRLGMFGDIVPVSNPDDVNLSSLVKYESEREQIISNTIALLNDKPAQNVLLTGDAGTGKSSSIKAIVNEFADQGLRIVQVKKDEIFLIPSLTEKLAKLPLKFIIFIDDISFSSDDENYSDMKMLLEGSLSMQPRNVVIYATSNRRHIVKEKFADRNGDEIHVNDAIQEMVSLSERFGLRVNFSKPNKDTYLAIVNSLAKEYDLQIEQDELFAQAEQFAILNGGRSGRLARQFVEQISIS